MAERKKDNPRPHCDVNHRASGARGHASRRRSVTPATRGVQSSAIPPKNEMDDYRSGAKALARPDCDLVPSKGSVTPAIDIKMCKIGDETYLTLDCDMRAHDAFMRACGTKDPDFFHGLLHQIASASSNGEHPDEPGIKFMLAFIKGIEPRDQIEAMLIAQMAACHAAAMRFANRLAHAETLQEQESAERTFNKLMRTFAALVETLQRYRAGREDRVVVQQNVSVSDGGQAIVGHVTRPRPRLKKHVAVTPALADARQRP